jgi:catechol 2,3-dioxygenase-like lactoylglutathione lyase family enzyme
VLQHVSIEVAPSDRERMLEFWEAVGFRRVEAPEALGGYVDWVEREGTQIHFIYTEEATVPLLGHPAVVAPEFEETLQRLEQAGFETEEHAALWGARRVFATAPGGQKVELMESPPPPSA